MAELQTVSAAFDVARLAWAACVFLKKIKDADRTAAEVHERVSRLRQVLDGVRKVLETREETGIAPIDDSDTETEKRIHKCIRASGIILRQVEKKVGGFESSNETEIGLINRSKIALRQSNIAKLQIDLEARISALQTELSLLQLADQAHSYATNESHHQEVLDTIAQLGAQLGRGNELLHSMLLEQRKLSTSKGASATLHLEDSTAEDVDNDALESLAACLRMAEDVHERYTSEYAPDDQSLRFHRGVVSEEDRDSHITTPVSEPGLTPVNADLIAPPNRVEAEMPAIDDDDDGGEEIWPLEILNMHIEAYHERANREREQGHYNQAEVNLQCAIRYSEIRQSRYNVVFNDRVHFQEDVAVLYQKQGKWGEAVKSVHQLLRESTDDLDQARQNHLLASIYHDRHQNRNGSLSNATDDIENAERHAKRAFNKRYDFLKAPDPPHEEVERHNSCISLLVRILELRDKTVEANEIGKLISDGSSTTSDSLRRLSTAKQPTDFVIVQDKNEMLIDAVKSGDNDQIQNLVNDSDVDIERPCRQGKTPLMHAVEGDESTVHKLLDPMVGGDVNNTNKRGLTALHHAAGLGLHDMVRCLLHHDAEIDAKDKRGETPLMKAVQNDQGTIVQILCDNGADIETKNVDEWSVLHYATRLTKMSMINQLLDLAPDLKDAVDQAGKTALHHCADLELVDQASALLVHKNHVDANAVDSVSRSPLYFAASKPPTSRRENMVGLLVKHGARMDENRPPPRHRDYEALKQFQVPRRASALTRHDSLSTEGSVGTTSTGVTKLSRIFSGRMHIR